MIYTGMPFSGWRSTDMPLIKFIGHIYYLILPVTSGGVLNMIFVTLIKWRIPINKRLFGENKTWQGFFGMIVLSGFSAWIIWGNFYHGAWLGFAYVLFELPNSFIKRRLGIKPGATGGVIQTFFDLADSAIGCILFLRFIYPLTWLEAVSVFIVSITTHCVINRLLYFSKLKKQKG